MDCGLEQFLLAVGLSQQLRGKLTDITMAEQVAAISLELEQLLWRDVYRHPLPKIHLSRVQMHHGANDLPSMQQQGSPGASNQ